MADRPGTNYSFGTPSEEQLAAKKRRKLRTALIIGGAIVVLAFSMGWNPPVGTVHKFTKVSDYNSEKESGCTNSGEGCHGSEKAFRDFNDYHPDAECTTCHDYQGVGCIPCHSPNKNHECALCHDGSMKNAQDRVRITDSYPKGHYRESTHTAMGTDMDAEVRSAEGGEAKATCGDCHSRDLRKSHTGVPIADGSEYGSDVGCGECHNDLTTFGQSEVKVDWKNDACDDCHRVGAKTQMHAVKIADAVDGTGAQACGETGTGCHEGNDLHALHPDKPVSCGSTSTAGEPGCHDLAVESHAPTATVCGEGPGCHRGYRNDELTHAGDAKVHSPEGGAQAGDTSFHGVPCGSCHYMSADGRSLVDEHGLPTSERTQGAPDDCRNCHAHPASADSIEAGWPERDTSDACASCHGNEGLPTAHEADFGAIHVSDSPGCSSSGPGCHPTSDLTEIGAPTPAANLHSTCLRCHDRTASGGNMAYDPDKKTCGSARDCHNGSGDYDGVSDVHDGTGGRADGTDAAHHTAGTAQRVAVWTDPESHSATACGSCHSMQLGTEHVRPGSAIASGAGTVCERCHNDGLTAAGVVKASWTAKSTSGACAACHGKTGVQAPHTAIAAAHVAVELDSSGAVSPGTCSPAGCHPFGDLRSVHGGDCSGCHKATGSTVVRNETSCGGSDASAACHSGYFGTLGDAHGIALHSPTNSAQASDTVFNNVACGLCHDIRPNGSSLVTEHALWTSTMTVVPGDVCENCHSDTSGTTQWTILDNWSARDTTSACAACHTTLHSPALAVVHDSASDGCAATGGGCHPASDMSQVGVPTTAGIIHSTCLRCHDRTASGGNVAYDPTKKTCGSGRACHGTLGQYDTSSSVHAGPLQTVDGTDAAHHVAGEAQRVATYTDAASGTDTACYRCHKMALWSEHARPNSAIGTSQPSPPNTCVRCHDGAPVTMEVVKGNWTSKETSTACADCHGQAGVNAAHHSIDTSHTAVERNTAGTITPGFCVRPGCHISSDVRVVHEYYVGTTGGSGCTISLCHTANGDIRSRNRMSCGGVSGSASCHTGTSETTHTIRIGGVAVPVNHSAQTTWTVGGVDYQTADLGCFGCHPNDLRAVHSTALIVGSMEGGGATTCAVCHEHVMPAAGAFRTLPAVEAAIASGDRRCDACHSSGTAVDGPAAVASAHKDTVAIDPLPAGKTWSDPLDDWRTGYDAMTGGGHGGLPYQYAGAGQTKLFPVTTFTVTVGRPGTYRWSLPPNSGNTLWLDPAVYPSATSTDAIQHLTVKCSDCHDFLGSPTGPHGAAVGVSVVAGYSDTEYANPTHDAYQFEPTNAANPAGYEPVVCFKCHTIDSGSVPGTTSPGGFSRHRTHWKYSAHTTTTAGIWGAKCIDCHVRIPHAWRRPRLTVRTVVTTDGAVPDQYPYIPAGYNGLAGIKLANISGTSISPGSCAQIGCYDEGRASYHPFPSQIDTQPLWP